MSNPIPLTLKIRPSSGCRSYDSACGRFSASRDRYLGVWKCYDFGQAWDGTRPSVLVKARSRAKLEAKLGEIAPTLPPRGVAVILRPDGSTIREIPLNAEERSAIAAIRADSGLTQKQSVVMLSGFHESTFGPGMKVYVLWVYAYNEDRDLAGDFIALVKPTAEAVMEEARFMAKSWRVEMPPGLEAQKG